eukprot:TRINITY_DN1624_c0_g1_i1.p1 TRINITY_DN1624_c0_g1~~TRINITY_DN1624_c0_g1_i1.p1  ORF type:complete len:160 (-),score=15.81 TRINITY_DN1624_c0_g1_i1:50-529(-)
MALLYRSLAVVAVAALQVVLRRHFTSFHLFLVNAVLEGMMLPVTALLTPSTFDRRTGMFGSFPFFAWVVITTGMGSVSYIMTKIPDNDVGKISLGCAFLLYHTSLTLWFLFTSSKKSHGSQAESAHVSSILIHGFLMAAFAAYLHEGGRAHMIQSLLLK